MAKFNKKEMHSLGLLSTIFKLFQPIYPFPLEWDPKTNSFSTLGKGHPKYRMFHLVVYILIGLLAPVCTVMMLANQERFKPEGVIFGSVTLPMALLLVGVANITERHLNEIMAAYRNMGGILRDIEKIPHEWSQEGDRKWRRTIFYLTHSLKWVCIGTPVVLPLFLVVEELDMFYSAEVVLLHPGFALRLLTIPTRYFCCILVLMEGWRIYSLFISLLFHWLEMQFKYFEMLRSKVRQKQFVGWYVKGQLAANILEDCMNQWLGVTLLALFAVVVMCSVYSIKYFGRIPFLVYWFIPLKAGFDGSILYLAFPFVIGCHEVTAELLREAKLGVRSWALGGNERKIAKRELQALSPISIRSGSAFVLKRNTKCSFYSAVVGRTVEGILIDDD